MDNVLNVKIINTQGIHVNMNAKIVQGVHAISMKENVLTKMRIV